MKPRLQLPALMLATLAVAGCTGGGGSGDGDAASGERLDVPLEERNGSGQTGTATFTASEGKTNVVVALVSEFIESEVQPAGIYAAACDAVADADAVVELPDVMQGIGGATIDASIGDLTSEPHAIAVRMSAEDDTVAACGEIAAPDSG